MPPKYSDRTRSLYNFAEPSREPENGLQGFADGKSTVRSRLRQPLRGRRVARGAVRARHVARNWRIDSSPSRS